VQASSRVRSRYWAPAVVAVAGLLGMAIVLIVVGELITHAGFLSWLRSADDHISQHLADHRTSGWNGFSSLGSKSAETLPIILGGLLIELVLVVRRRWRDLLLVPIGLAVELLTFLLVNEIVRRQRPDVEKLGIVPGTFSFPSGHTAATIVLYGSIVLLITLRPRSAIGRSRVTAILGWVLVLLITVAVGYARVYRGMHHVSDVVTGAIMGLGALAVAVTATRASSLADEQDREAPTTSEASGASLPPIAPSRKEVPA